MNLEPFAKLFQWKCWHVHFRLCTYTHDGRWLFSNASRVWMDGILGPTCWIQKECSQRSTFSCNICHKQWSCCASPICQQEGQGTYLKMSVEKAKTGKRAAEHGVLATVHYYATKFPEPLKESLVRTWKNAKWAWRVWTVNSQNYFSITAICKNLDSRNYSAIQ